MNRRVFTRCIATTLTALVTLGTLGLAAHAKVIHVRKAAPGPVHDGSSWERAFSTVSEALAASSNLDEVWVAEGTYPERIELRYGVGLYGGFAGTETGREQRDPDAHVTTLDGERKGTVVVARANAVNTVVDGFHIANGMREERTWYGPGYITESGMAGGGIFCEHAPTLFANLVIRDCAGYGLDCRGESTVILRDSTIRDCDNAGINCRDSAPLITRNIIRGNDRNWVSPMSSGAIASVKSSAKISDNVMVGNAHGVLFSDSLSILINNTIADNQGSGVYVSYTSHYSRPGDPVIVNNGIAFNRWGITYSLTGDMAFPDAAGIHHNVVANNTEYDYDPTVDPAVIQANIIKAPAFVDRRKGDYHLSPFSPAIDAGDDSVVQPGATDMDGEARIQFGHVDIGADESSVPYQAPVPVVVRVRPDGDDASDGATWASALRTVQAALDLAAERGGGEVWVAEGNYNANLVLFPGISLYGGFAGTEAERAGRDIRRHKTVLDGQRQGTVVTVRTGADASTVVDGFTVRNGVLVEGAQGYGCGIACEPGSAPVITRNLLLHNAGKTAPPSGRPTGGVYGDNASPIIAGNVVMDNGGIGIYCAGGSPVIAGNTVTGNSGAAIRLDASPALVENNIAAFNMAGIRADPATPPTFRGNCVFGNGGYAYNGVADPTGTDGNIAADPRFASYAYGNWHLQPDSPCVNAGTPDADPRTDTDLDGQPRVQGGRIDIGADESDGTTWTMTPRIVRVRPDADDANDGSTWALAKRTVGAAVEAARSSGGEVWVAAGAYVESVLLPPHVYLYGGFAGQETQRDERRWTANTTTLQSDTVVVSAHYGYRSGAVDGFTIRNTSASMRGLAMQCEGSSPEIANNTILMSGNGIDGTGAPNVRDCVLRPAEGAVAYYGIQITSLDAPLSITHNVIRQCEVSGIYLYLSGGLIANNAVIGGGTGIVAMTGSGLTQEVSNNTVVGARLHGIKAAAATIANNLLVRNGYGFFDAWKATLTLRHNNSYGNTGPNYPAGVLDPTGADGNISLDPKLTSADDWHIRPDSPCVDAGADAFVTWSNDLDGQARIAGGRVDIGADEVHAELGYTVADVQKALAIAAGLASADAAAREHLDVVPDGPGPGINVADAVRLIRKAMWLEPNP